jgi:Serine phosphatase RsbU, regulator of sigma subunit
MDKVESHYFIFIPEIVVCALCLFLDEVSWLVQGIPEYAMINRITCAALHICYYTIGLLFWIYMHHILNFNSKLVKITGDVFFVLYLLLAVVCILDIFLPIYFTVGSDGYYRRAILYSLRPVVYILIVPGAVEILVKSEASNMTKAVTAILFVFPVISEVMTFFHFGISTKPAAILIAIILNFGVLVAEREKKFVATQNELDIASKIQDGLLPTSFPAFPDRKEFDVYASTKPAKEVGGDFYDFFMIDDTHLAILIADVSDKGIGAALFMAISKINIKTRGQMGGSPSEIISYADKVISEKNEAGMFVTLWLGIIDLTTGHMDVCNAGHDYPAILRADKESVQYTIDKEKHGPPVGFLPGMEYPEISYELHPGDRIFLYTDGVTDAKNRDGNRFETDRLLKTLNANIKASDEQLITAVRTDIDRFIGGEPQFDDVTMLSFTYFG